jgi:hypothetical protein
MTNTARDHSTYRAARRQAARAMYRAALLFAWGEMINDDA